VDAERCYLEFVEAVELALVQWEARDILIIGEAAKEDWHAAAAWCLERGLPKISGRRERHEIGNADDQSSGSRPRLISTQTS
jgi:hypothetical protein